MAAALLLLALGAVGGRLGLQLRRVRLKVHPVACALRLVFEFEARGQLLPEGRAARAVLDLAPKRAVGEPLVEMAPADQTPARLVAVQGLQVPPVPGPGPPSSSSSSAAARACASVRLVPALGPLAQEDDLRRVDDVGLDALGADQLGQLALPDDVVVGAPPDLQDVVVGVLVHAQLAHAAHVGAREAQVVDGGLVGLGARALCQAVLARVEKVLGAHQRRKPLGGYRQPARGRLALRRRREPVCPAVLLLLRLGRLHLWVVQFLHSETGGAAAAAPSVFLCCSFGRGTFWPIRPSARDSLARLARSVAHPPRGKLIVRGGRPSFEPLGCYKPPTHVRAQVR
mmetsp:Transcript_24215/g.52069  ORF Transcript_24215/g.52069 Transcript_24215/m.52069 type:complete len:342 (-) Transcript_24215:497-1522(-)